MDNLERIEPKVLKVVFLVALVFAALSLFVRELHG